MGTWGVGPFENDTACDWKYDLEEIDDHRLIESTLRKIDDAGTNYLKAPEADEAIAAAETIARLKGSFYVRNAYTETVDAWVAKHNFDPPQELVDSAIKAMERILTPPSELLELWEESDEFGDWKQQMEDLKTRLK